MFYLQRHAQAAPTCWLHAAAISMRAPHPWLGGAGGGGLGLKPLVDAELRRLGLSHASEAANTSVSS